MGGFTSSATRVAADINGWIPIADRAGNVVVHDPMRGSVRAALTRPAKDTGVEVQIELPSGESLVLTTHATLAGAPTALPTAASGAAIPVLGPWTVRFVAGGPVLPPDRTTDRLSSWTTLDGDDLKAFSGTAVYSTRFPLPGERVDLWRLDLGSVHDSANVRLNGHDLETLIGPHFALMVSSDQLRQSNLLEVSVTNLMANRIAALDRSGVQWKTFYNVNFPSRLPENRGTDALFTAARWEPLVSGLLGPVVLTPMRAAR